mmetsp:Transcript_18465/g.45327  ORF Transcript_18465/g.45327 Transcript_18465/m.45327 type:complete len:509 (+) Transcript_18465:48-1574(+)
MRTKDGSHVCSGVNAERKESRGGGMGSRSARRERGCERASDGRELVFRVRWCHPLSLACGMVLAFPVAMFSKMCPPTKFSCYNHIEEAIHQIKTPPPYTTNNVFKGDIAPKGQKKSTSKPSWFYSDIHDEPHPIPSIELTYWRPENFNLTRCCAGFKVFIYPVNPFDEEKDWKLGLDVKFEENWLYYTPHLRMWALRNRNMITSNPKEACLFVPAATATHAGRYVSCWNEKAHCSRFVIGQWLQRLPHWDGGRNHAVFDQEDMWGIEDSGRVITLDGKITTQFSKYASFDAGKAIVLNSSPSREGFRYGYDISVARTWADEQKYVQRSDLRRIMTREKLACLVGTFKNYMKFHQLRQAVHNLHDGKDIFVVTGTEEEVGGWKNLLLKCKYALIPPGGDTFRSFRFLEAMSAGAVPVIINAGGMVPYESFIDWSSVGIVVEEPEIDKIPERLRAISNDEYSKKHARTVQAYESMFSNPEHVIDTTILFLRDEIKTALRKYHKNICHSHT